MRKYYLIIEYLFQLHIAAANGYYDVASYLLTKKFNVNIQDNDGWSPAMAAACWGQIPVLELLAKSGADLDVKTKDNKSLVGKQLLFSISNKIKELSSNIICIVMYFCWLFC